MAHSEAPSAHHRLRDTIRGVGGTVGEGGVFTHVPQPLRSPYGSSRPLEHDSVRAIDVGGALGAPPDAAFMDGIQRYAVIGRIGLVPIVRGYVAAAVLRRRDGLLWTEQHLREDFLVVPLNRLAEAVVGELRGAGLPIHDSGDSDRPHPILDVHLSARVVEQRRERVEHAVVRQHTKGAAPGWLVVDGSLQALDVERGAPVIGLVKSHETQFLQGHDLGVALTLAAGSRSSVFLRTHGSAQQIPTWYLRLWPWEEHDLFHGLVRLEWTAGADAASEATEISRWILAERAPLSAPDGRWDRLIYPIHQVETYLQSHIGEWL